MGKIRIFRRWIALFTIGMFFFFPSFTQGDSSQEDAEGWAKRAGEIHQLVKEERWPEAREHLAELAVSFSRADFSGKDVSVESIHVLSECLLELERQLNRVRPDPEAQIVAADRLRLAFDALSHRHQPLWHQYYPDLLREIDKVEDAARKGSGEEVRNAVDGLSSGYQMIRPAIVVSKSSLTVEKVDSIIAYIRSQAGSEMNREALVNGAHRLERMLEPLFYGSEEDVIALGRGIDPPEFLSFLWVGGVIAAVLGYVGWRKYRVERVAMRG